MLEELARERTQDRGISRGTDQPPARCGLAWIYTSRLLVYLRTVGILSYQFSYTCC